MDISLKNRLSFKQARLAVLIGFALGTLLSLFQIAIDYASEDASINREIKSLLEIIQNPASRIAYNIDSELAQELTLGLLRSPAVVSARLTDNNDAVLASVERPMATGRYRVFSDWLFGESRQFQEKLHLNHLPDETIGTLYLTVDTFAFGSHFLQRAEITLLNGFVRSLALAGILTILFYATLTKPLVRVIRELSSRDPRNPDQGKITCPPHHEQDEIGVLVATFNRQFETMGSEFSRRRAAEDRLTEHLNELENIVSARTNELKASNIRLRESNEELQIARSTALDMAHARSAFLAHMSHEIRTPLNGLLGMLALSLDSPLSAEQRQQLMIAHDSGKVLVEGRAIGQRIGAGKVRIIKDVSEMDKVQPGDVLVSDMTDPDWEPVMKRASAIVTNRGGRTCHAAIIARELGIPAVVGCGNATQTLQDGQGVTVSCAEGDTGYIFEGELGFDIKTNSVDAMPELPFKIMMNVGNPDRAFDFAQLPNAGVGLARLEFIINRMIGVHPKALLNYSLLPPEIKESVDKRIAGYHDPVGFYVDKLVEGISTLAAAFTPKKVIVRLSDFKSNEYANLIGGKLYEPEEENPMLGFRGASRYISENFRDCFELECRALKRVREEMGLTNVEIMVPFVRTLGEASQVIDLLAANGLKRGENGLRIIMMCELPSNAILAEEFLEYFDGFSIGSNDLTQYLLAVDRNNPRVADLYDYLHPAVLQALQSVVRDAHAEGKPVSICGEMAGDPAAAVLLMAMGFDSLSMNATNLPKVKWMLRQINLSKAKELLAQLMTNDNPQVISSSLQLALKNLGLSRMINPSSVKGH
ncbi:Phosphoenolpyruvate synthase [Pseudomonas savastanoi]|uniref:histidine kinase n=10 Tax=Pseudomonas syringae group TaxID=136849 RepID=A0A3M6A8M8_PSESS|nr:Phosphoenolpyruvate synthase [Pseudomonas savastanoi]